MRACGHSVVFVDDLRRRVTVGSKGIFVIDEFVGVTAKPSVGAFDRHSLGVDVRIIGTGHGNVQHKSAGSLIGAIGVFIDGDLYLTAGIFAAG